MARTFFRFHGRLFENDEFEHLPGWETESIAARPPQGSGEYTVELRDEQGDLLVAVPVEVDFSRVAVRSEEEMKYVRVVAYLPVHPASARVVFRHGERELFREELAEKPPTIEIRRARSMGERIDVEWEADSPAGKELTFHVTYLCDGRGRSMVRGLQETAYRFETTDLPGGREVRVAVLATDGFRSSFAVSEALEVAEKAPRPWIQSPGGEGPLPADQPITARGQALDVSGASLPADGLTWHVDGEVVGEGPVAVLAPLEPGTHRIELVYGDQRERVDVEVAPRSEAHESYRRRLAELDAEDDGGTENG